MISTVIDLSEHTDDFSHFNLEMGYVAREFYSVFIPYIVSMLFPLFVFLSVIFFTSKMANRAEFIAILAAGVSLKRILYPYLIGSVLLAAILWWANDTYIPKANVRRTAFEAKYFQTPDINVISRSIYMRIDSFSYCGIRYYDTSNRSGGGFFMERIKGNKVVYNMRADGIIWDTTKKKWRLSSVIERNITPSNESVQYRSELFKSFNFTPKDLKRDEYMKLRLTTSELSRMIKLEKLRGSETVNELILEKAHRAATPVAVIILTLIGAILACRKIRGGSGIHLAAGFLICAVFILADRFSTIFSTKGNLNPILAAWLPNFVFGILTVWLYKKAPK